MRTFFLLFIKLLRAISEFAAAIIFMFFINHILGFIFGFSFKSIGEPTLEILGTEIAGIAIIGVIYWLLDKLYNKVS